MGQIHAETYEEMGVPIVSYEEADIISIATPDCKHGETVVWALENGKDVFCEKPLCTKRLDLGVIKCLAGFFSPDSPNRCIGHNYPLRHTFERLRQYDPGKIQRFEASYVWGRHEKLKTTWRKDDPNYSLILGGMIHVVDLFFHLTDLEIHVDSVAWSGHPPYIVYALCQIPHGIAQFSLDGAPGKKQHGHGVMISGELGTVWGINDGETDKKACLREFIENLKAGTHQNDFRAIDLCLQIENIVSTSANR